MISVSNKTLTMMMLTMRRSNMPNNREIEQNRPLLITLTGFPKMRAANSHGTGRLQV
jgi:hypothetical protein